MSRDFNGTTSYIEATSAPVTDVPLTLAAWFNADIVTANIVMLSVAASTVDNSFALIAGGAAAGDPVQAQTRVTSGATTNATSAAGAFTANNWFHGAAVFSAANNRLAYRNGVAGTANTTSLTMSGIDTVGIGVRPGATRANYFDGEVMEAAIWNVALDAAEIKALSEGFKPTQIRPNALVFYAPIIREIADYARGVTLNQNATTVTPHHRRYG